MIFSSQKAYRNELKYFLNYSEYQLIRIRLNGVMKQDQNVGDNGQYSVRSLYFDDYYNSAYRQKKMGVLNRQKFRLRIYNYSNKFIRLERKIKNDRYVYKQSSVLTTTDVKNIIRGDYDFLLKRKDELSKVLYYEFTAKNLRPRLIIDYEREPFISEFGDIRITFDKNVRVGMGKFNLYDSKMSMVETLESGNLIMEVKYTRNLPNYLKRLLPINKTEHVAASKYVMGCEKTLYRRQSDR